ncbi:hypothetical protein, partial [Pseudomonas sp. Pseusp97]|uniref:hypothetical protein n=1 Tax=Pseudomonas sp. Pseusp97 TaxID=3243065 RepID=UPI0039A6C2EA
GGGGLFSGRPRRPPPPPPRAPPGPPPPPAPTGRGHTLDGWSAAIPMLSAQGYRWVSLRSTPSY